MTRNARGRSSASPVIKNPARYKTEQCGTFARTGICPYGHKCQFAHGLDELRLRQDQPSSYKTKACRSFASTGRCPYGQRCRFVHGDALEALQLAALGLGDGKLLPPSGGLRAVQQAALKDAATPTAQSPASGSIPGWMSPLSPLDSPWQSPGPPGSPLCLAIDSTDHPPYFSDMSQVSPRKQPLLQFSGMPASLLSASQTRPSSVYPSGRTSPNHPLLPRPSELLSSLEQLQEPIARASGSAGLLSLPADATLLPQYGHPAATLLAMSRGGGVMFANPPMASPRVAPARAPVHPHTEHPQTTLDMRIAEQLWRVLDDGPSEGRVMFGLRPSF